MTPSLWRSTRKRPDPSLPVETPEALHTWVKHHIGVTIPTVPMVEGHSAPFDYLSHVYFEGPSPARLLTCSPAHDSPIDCLVWANRGGGKTFMGAVATALDLLHKPGIEVRILAGSLEQAGKMYAHLRRIFERPGLAGHVRGRVTSRRITLTSGSTAELLAQSDFSVRGTRVQRLRCDEVELFEPSIWEAAQLTTRSRTDGRGRTIHGTVECLSTMHVPHGLMARLVREAAEGRRRLFKWSLLDVLEGCAGRACRADGGDGPLKRSGKVAEWQSGKADEVAKWQSGEVAKCSGGGEPAASSLAHSATLSLCHSATSRSVPLPVLAADCPLLNDCAGLAKSTHNFGGAHRVPGHVSIADAIRMKARVSRGTWEAEMLCLRADRTATVYPGFDAAVHVVHDVHDEVAKWRSGKVVRRGRARVVACALCHSVTLPLCHFFFATLPLCHFSRDCRRGNGLRLPRPDRHPLGPARRRRPDHP